MRMDIIDCVVPSSRTDFEEKTAALQDWARIPSIRDAAMNGGAVGLLFDPGVSGDYIEFLSHPALRDGSAVNDGFKDDNRGNPTADGSSASTSAAPAPGWFLTPQCTITTI